VQSLLKMDKSVTFY